MLKRESRSERKMSVTKQAKESLPGYWFAWVFISLLMVANVGIISCKDDDETTPAEPWGSWTHTVTGAETFHTQLNHKDSNFEWIVLDTLSSHTNNYGKVEITGSQLRLYDNPDCTNDGTYHWSVAGENIMQEVVDDACEDRVLGLTGTWDKLDTIVMLQLSGSWTKM